MASNLKRVSERTDTTITALAEREGRTFVAQLERVVDAGLDALGLDEHGNPKSSTRRRPAKKATAATG